MPLMMPGPTKFPMPAVGVRRAASAGSGPIEIDLAKLTYSAGAGSGSGGPTTLLTTPAGGLYLYHAWAITSQISLASPGFRWGGVAAVGGIVGNSSNSFVSHQLRRLPGGVAVTATTFAGNWYYDMLTSEAPPVFRSDLAEAAVDHTLGNWIETNISSLTTLISAAENPNGVIVEDYTTTLVCNNPSVLISGAGKNVYLMRNPNSPGTIGSNGGNVGDSLRYPLNWFLPAGYTMSVGDGSYSSGGAGVRYRRL
jgi:hypothetical protein